MDDLTSKIVPMFRLEMAQTLSALIMFLSAYFFVADITEKLLAVAAVNSIALGFLLIYGVAVWASSTEFEIDIIIVFCDRALIFHLLSNEVKLEHTVHISTGWILFKVFLTFCFRETRPAKFLEATIALYMSTFCIFHQLIVLSTFRTRFGAML
jgi:hypothetical protein